MNFFKEAQEFASSGNTGSTDNTSGTAPDASGDGGSFGNLVSSAANTLKSQGAAPAGDGSAAPADDGSAAPPAADGNLPGGRTAPTNQDLMHSGQLLFDAAQGQKVDQSQLAGAASDLLGGLEAHGNLDDGTYGKYIDQAQGYLDKYGQSHGQSAAGAGAPPAQSAPDQSQ